jgi:tRNA 2-selenouridine synthase SelU
LTRKQHQNEEILQKRENQRSQQTFEKSKHHDEKSHQNKKKTNEVEKRFTK